MSDDALEIRRLLEEAGRLAERSGMPPEEFVAAFMEVLRTLMIEQGDKA